MDVTTVVTGRFEGFCVDVVVSPRVFNDIIRSPGHGDCVITVSSVNKGIVGVADGNRVVSVLPVNLGKRFTVLQSNFIGADVSIDFVVGAGTNRNRIPSGAAFDDCGIITLSSLGFFRNGNFIPAATAINYFKGASVDINVIFFLTF